MIILYNILSQTYSKAYAQFGIVVQIPYLFREAATNLNQLYIIYISRNSSPLYITQYTYINRYSTPLHDAVCCGRVDVAKFLVARGANVNELDYKNMTPLKLAKR